MVPDKFNMVDMDGIDLIMMQGEEVPGLYDRLVESIAQCRYQCLYNWFFDGILIPPTYVKMEVGLDEEVRINEGVVVTQDDIIHIYSIEPPPVDPEIIPLLAEENGVYNVPDGKDGFNPVTVDVPSYIPVIGSISITENGTYTAPSEIDGYSPIVVNVPTVPPKYYIYNNGVFNVPFNNPVTQSPAQTVTINSNSIDFGYTSTANTGFYLSTSNKIDFSNYNLLVIELSTEGAGAGQYFPAFGMADVISSFQPAWTLYSAFPSNITNGKVGFVFNNISEKYFGFAGFTFTASIKAIYLTNI